MRDEMAFRQVLRTHEAYRFTRAQLLNTIAYRSNHYRRSLS